MKTKLGLIVALAIFVAGLVGCSQDEGPVVPLNALSTLGIYGVNGTVGEYCTTLYAGQDIDAGTVCVDIIDMGDTEFLHITYNTTGNWELTEAHLWVGTVIADMPQTRKGNPKIGNFPFNSGDITGQTTYTFIVDLVAFDGEAGLCGNSLLAAAHAALQLVDDNGDVIQTETGWGNGDPMVERGSWATFFGIEFTCADVPPGQNSETVWAYDCVDATCFSDIPDEGINKWGWTNGAYGPGTYYLDIYAGAAHCDLTKGTLVGLLTVVYDGETATVTYNTCGNYTMTETQLYVGTDILAWDDNPADPGYTVAPGQFPSKNLGLGSVQTDEHIVTGFEGEDIYVVAHAVVWGDYVEGDCGERGCVPPVEPCTLFGAIWAEFTHFDIDPTVTNGAIESRTVVFCDGKTAAIQVTDISSPKFRMDGTPIPDVFFIDDHLVYGDLDLSNGSMFFTRCRAADGTATANMLDSSYTMTWDFGDTPLDHTNFFMVGQFYRPANVLTVTAYAADGETPLDNPGFVFEAIRATTDPVPATPTFTEPLVWDSAAGTLAKDGGQGDNSGYGFFNIPVGMTVGKIVFELNDPSNTNPDALQWGMGCYGCIQ